jgi:hypothetical protein
MGSNPMVRTSAPGPDVLRRVVELACRAPSMHNTQPWLWRLTDGRIDLYADPERRLPVADPQDRALTMGCGAALHHAQVAASAFGLQTSVHRLPDPDNPRHLATIDLAPGQPSAHAARDLRAIETRCTDRSRFTSWPMSEARLGTLVDAVADPGVHLAPVTTVSDRVRISLLLSRAVNREEADPRFLAEQVGWIDHSAVDGIPAATFHANGHPVRPSRFAHTGIAESGELVEITDGLLVLGTDGDDVAAWLRAGEALSALWLRATVEGLSVVPLSQVVEVDETRSALQHEMLEGRWVPQTLVRIGWQEIGSSERPRSPRRPVDDVLVSEPVCAGP